MKKKILGLSVLFLVYVFAVLIGYFSFFLLKDYIHFLLNILIADVIATVFVWLMGVIFKTPSMYDPYWSVQSFFIYLGLLFHFHNWNIFTTMALVVVVIYSIRLTANFIIGFHDLSYVDWRYRMLKEKSGRWFQVVNLLGICMFPTMVIYTASLPLMVYASLPFETYSYIDMIGLGVVLFGVLLELISDHQMKVFIKNRTSREEVINIGLWSYSRHPNYLGEILIWFGIAMVLIVHRFGYWYLASGAFINLLMFIFISISMEEKHMKEYKPGLSRYIESTHMLLIMPKKKG